MSYSGPFNYENSWVGSGFRQTARRAVYRSTKPWTSPLPYTAYRASGYGDGDGFWAEVSMNAAASLDWSVADRVVYDGLRSQIGKQASLALTLLDLPKSIEMIRNRSLQLISAVRDVRRGNVAGALRHLGAESSRHNDKLIKRLKVKDPASSWLEINFGWKPLISDIYQACDVLQNEFDFTSVRSSSKGSLAKRIVHSSDVVESYIVDYRVISGGHVRVTNPNLFLATQLGLTNPVAVAWDFIPFSFVVDWFLPVNSFLKSFSNDYGIEFFDQYTGRKVHVRAYDYKNTDDPRLNRSGSLMNYSRALGGIPRPSFLSRVRDPNLTPWHAATSVSLLIQNLGTLRKLATTRVSSSSYG